jgi:HAD superfamily hydrolase (TIGR01484 family)
VRQPRPIGEAELQEWQPLRYIFTDIDDTLTSDGRLTADVYAILEKLSAVGIGIVPVTGRPAGWCDMIARFWPVRAVVGENGAFYFSYDAKNRRMIRAFSDNAETRANNRLRLQNIRDEVLATISGAAVASDQAYRETDLAIDFAEDVPRLCDAQIDQIVDICRSAGAVAKVSSIHVNCWFGEHNKASMTRQLMRDKFGLPNGSPEAHNVCAFIGDSPNDAEMFAALKKSVGVANLNELIDRCEAIPRWITRQNSGAGFREFAQLVLDAKGA